MKYLKLLFLAACISLSASCTKDSQTTTLVINIRNSSGDLVAGANVTLYRNQTDLTNNTNIYDLQTSDNNGNATFTLNNADEYFFNIYRSMDCATNVFSTIRTGTLKAGEVNNIKTILSQTATVTFNNTSGDGYEVKINGTVWKTILAGQSSTTVIKTGTYALHYTQATNVSGTPKESDATLVLNSCDTKTVNLP